MKIIMSLIIGMLVALWQAYCLKVLWIWFMMPLGVKEINVAHAFGIIVVINLIMMRIPEKAEYTLKEDVINLMAKILACALFLGMGYIAYLCMW